MLNQLTSTIDFQSKALVLRAERQRILATNIANADTPGYVARDMDFQGALRSAKGAAASHSSPMAQTHAGHMALPSTAGTAGDLVYATPSQASLDKNTVDLDRERANFVDNAIRYEATLRFINGNVRTMLSAIQGQ